MKICVLVQNLYTLGGIQRVVTTILNELVNDENYDIVTLNFGTSSEIFLLPQLSSPSAIPLSKNPILLFNAKIYLG